MAGLTVEDALEAGQYMYHMLLRCGKYDTHSMHCSDEFAKRYLSSAELARYVETQNTLGSTEYRINRARNILSGIKDERITNTFDVLGKMESLRREKLEFYNKEEERIYAEIGVEKQAYLDEQGRLLHNVCEMFNGNNQHIDTPLTDAVKSWEARNPDKASYFDKITDESIRLMTELDTALNGNFDKAIAEIGRYFSGQKGIDGHQPSEAGQA
jgi:hypothetical protein